MNNTFTAIDFEITYRKRWSICQIGLVHYVDGVIQKKLSVLIQPQKNFYRNHFISLEGISDGHQLAAPIFDEIWYQIEPFIKDQHVVASFLFPFNFLFIDSALAYYGIPIPPYFKHCIYLIYDKTLATLCKEHNIAVNYYDSVSIATACGELYLISSR